MSKKVTHEDFIKNLLRANKHFKEGKFVLLGKYINSRDFILIGTEYGVCRMSANTLLAGSSPTTINSAIDKHDFFLKELYDCNQNYREGVFDVLSEYVNDYLPLRVKTKYGVCITTAHSLRIGGCPRVQSAEDKTQYWLNYAKEKNTNFDDYTFEKTIFINGKENVIITCSVHGDFNIRPTNFTGKNQGCAKCSKLKIRHDNKSAWTHSSWNEAAKNSKYFDCFKVYIIRCWNEEEEFYKIGKTYRSLLERFKSSWDIPYEWDIIDEYICDSAIEASELEDVLKMENKDFLYAPSISFRGQTECFTKIDTKSSYTKIWRRLKEFS